MITVKFNNESYNAYVKNYQTGEAEIKTSLVDVPYADGQLDLTDYYGKVRYKNRTITINMRIFGSEDIVSIHHDIKNALHGKLAKVEFSDDDEGWYWYGRCSVGQGTRVNNYAYDFTITVDVEPYQYQDEETVLTITSNDFVADLEPYLYRTSTLGSIEYPTIVGGSVGWNQLVEYNITTITGSGITYTKNSDGSITVNGTATAVSSLNSATTFTGKKDHIIYVGGCPNGGSTSTYYFREGYTGVASTYDTGDGKVFKKTSDNLIGQIYIASGVTVNNLVFRPQIVDLTLVFGSTIADYIYSLETATAGAGVTWLKEHFPKMFGQYNAYDAGSIKSVEGVSEHKMVGKNLADSGHNWNVDATGIIVSADIYNCSIIGVVKGQTYIHSLNGSAVNIGVIAFYTSYPTIGSVSYDNSRIVNNPATFTAPITGYAVIRDVIANTNIQVELGSATEYEPYTSWSYPLDSSLELRGIPKLDSSNKLYYDGDTYASDGTVTRKYGIVDLGTLNWTAAGTMWFATLSGIQAVPDTVIPNAVCAKYVAVPWARGTSGSEEKVFCFLPSYNQLRIRDTSYSDAASFKTAMSGVYLVYELATLTTESSTSYTNPQRVGSTEEYVTESIVPVGHNTKYLERKTVTLEGQNADVLKVTNTMSITLKKDSTSVTLTEGTHSVGIIPLQDGENEIEVIPTTPTAGTITFNYANGRL